MLYVKINTHVTDHVRFAEAGAAARDLWVWGMLYAGKHETDGAIPMAAVLTAPWGSTGKANIKVAQRLVEVGLWERTDQGYQICRWAEQGNMTRAQMEEERAKARARMGKRRSGFVRPNEQANAERTSPDVPTSTSLSGSSGSSSAEIQSVTGGAGAPDWFAVEAVEMVQMTAGVGVDQIGARWLEYSASRKRKTWSMDAGDAAGWLTNVIRSERRQASERKPHARGAEITKQPYQDDAPWLKAGGED
jgi:hypothetical protein